MSKNTSRLSELKIGESATITDISADDKFKSRLADLGIVKCTRVVALHKSPSGDPTAYFIKGTVIALRSIDAEKIVISDFTLQSGDKNEKD